MTTDADNALETIAVRSALKTAMLRSQNVTIRYGRGSRPGTERVLRPIIFLDDDLFEAIQIAPEERAVSQKYRASCVVYFKLENCTINNLAAYAKCRNTIEYYERCERLTTKLAEIESSTIFELPSSVIAKGVGQYLWYYHPTSLPVLLAAPSDKAIAAFVARAEAVAVDGWGGSTWVVIDAMLKYQIDWPAWHRYSLHLERRLKAFAAAGNEIGEFNCSLEIPELDWPGLFNLHPSEIANSCHRITHLYAALSHVPAPIMLAYIHDVRPKQTKYYRSQMSGLTDEEVGLLNEYGLADKQALTDMVGTTSIDEMREALVLSGIPIPAKKSRRAPHLKLIMDHAESYPEITIALRRKRRTQFFKAPDPLTWEEFHDLRAQVIMMGRLLYQHLSGGTLNAPIAARLLCR